MSALTGKQRAVLDVLLSEPRRGFDLEEIARRADTSPEGAARTASSLAKHGFAVRFVGGVGPQRVHYQSAVGA